MAVVDQVTPIDHESTAMLLDTLDELRQAQSRAGNTTAAFLTGEALRLIRIQAEMLAQAEEVMTAQGRLLDHLAAVPRRWQGSLHRHGRKTRR